MAAPDTSAATPAMPGGPVLFAYDGCELAGLAIAQAGLQLAPGREALVVCVWQTGDVGFLPAGEQHFDAAQATQVRAAAEQTAAHGAALAENAGFRAQSVAIEAAPTWKGILEVADERQASLIVLGSHRRRGLQRHLLGSVAAAVASHAAPSVLVVHS
jgi:nucleotide-binding universal stress UspA family protein